MIGNDDNSRHNDYGHQHQTRKIRTERKSYNFTNRHQSQHQQNKVNERIHVQM